MRIISCLALVAVAVQGGAPALPDVYSFTMLYSVHGAGHNQTVYLDKPNQREKINGNSGPGTIQLNRPKDQGCTYSVYGAGGSSPGCSDWAATSQVGDPIQISQLTGSAKKETINGVVCDRFNGGAGFNISAWFKTGTNELVQTFSATDESTGTDHGLKYFSNWKTSVPANEFDIENAWNCKGPDQCKALPQQLL
jgi:hypothetical protein